MTELKLDYKEDYTVGEKGQRLSCRDCGTDRMNIIITDRETYAVCTKCNKFALIHDG